jgi:flagellar biosynthesis protein FlhA
MGYLAQKRKQTLASTPAPVASAAPAESADVGWSDVTPVDVLGLEVGYRLIPLVDKGRDGDLLKRIKAIRRKFAQEVGFLPPPIHIRDNLELKPGAYRVTLKGVEIGRHEANPGMHLAINPGGVTARLQGVATTDPAFGLPAVWIDAGERDHALAEGYTVVDASTVIATHLSQLVHTHAGELLGRTELQQLFEHLAKETPKLTEELTPKLLPLSTVQRVLQNLLDEGVHIRDMRTIIDVLTVHAARSQDSEELTALTRIALGRAIAQGLFPGGAQMQVMSLAPHLERLLMQAASSDSSVIEPDLAAALVRETRNAAQRHEQLGVPPVLVVPGRIRTLLARFLRRQVAQLKVLSHGEVPDSRDVKIISVVGES